jgi:response regulator RpfG family c-di-GMP phosphodiesterase
MVHQSRTDLRNLLLYRILIVEDHPLFRSAIKQLLTKMFRKIVVSEAGEAQEALQLVRSQWPFSISVFLVEAERNCFRISSGRVRSYASWS